VLGNCFENWSIRIGLQLEHRTDTLTGPLIRQSDDHRVGDSGKQPKKFLNFGRGNVLTVANHHILESSRDGHKTLRIDYSEVTCSKETSLVKSLRIR
jgi:hypothetical protein